MSRPGQRPRPSQLRARWAVVGTLALAAAAVGAALAANGPGPGEVWVQPVLGAADPDMKLMGAAESGEAWGFRAVPSSQAPPVVDGEPLEYGPRAGGREDQLAFLRWTRATGWRYEETPLEAGGDRYRGPFPNPQTARITPAGGGLLVGRDSREVGDPPVRVVKPVVLRRDPGGEFQALPDPPAGVLEPGEALAEDDGTGRAAAGAFDHNGRTAVLLAAIGPAADAAVVHWNGEAWSREPIDLPGDAAAGFRVLGIAATGADNAWLVARAHPGTGRGVMLFKRVSVTGGARWVERTLGDSPFARRTDTNLGLEEIEPLGGAAESITATRDGVWVDGSFRSQATDGGLNLQYFTLFFDVGSASVTGSWCDALDLESGQVCSHPLGARLSTQLGYRSFAWGGDGFGARVITNPLEPGGDGETNRGTYLRLDGSSFVRMPGGGGNFRAGGAFSAPDEGWLEGPVHITRDPEPQALRDSWPVAARAPLASVATAPGGAPGSTGAAALAVGPDGTVLRHQPGEGWVREFLLTPAGAVAKSTLRGAAWPEPARAHAVGDLGAMWLWRGETGLWERDPGAPIGFEGHLMDVAFAPGEPDRGYAVGRSGLLLRYGKSWTQEPLPPGFAGVDLTQIAFAGSEAIVAAGADLLYNDGGGWHVDMDARAAMEEADDRSQRWFAVAGLPDGGAVAAGRDGVLVRDSAGSAWRFADQPLPGSMAIAAAAVRAGADVRAVVSVVPVSAAVRYPPPDDIPEADPNVPPPLLGAFPLPPDGYVLRETANGWRDEQHTAFAGSGQDRPTKSDPVLDFALGAGGAGWAVGGWSGEADSAGRGSAGKNPAGRADRARAQTAAVFRYGEAEGAPPGAAAADLGLPRGPARLVVAGHAACEEACADLELQDIRPDRALTAALDKAAALRALPNGPRMMLYAGGRLPAGLTVGSVGREAGRYATLLGSRPVPAYPTASASDTLNGRAASFRTAFANFYAPFGAGPPPPGVDASRIPGASPGPGARTHYAFDSVGPEGTLRVIVIDNSRGSLADSNPHQNPIEEQASWLAAVLADSRNRGIPAVVIGSRDLNSRFSPRLNVAADGDQTTRLLVDGGASAYFFERPEENRAYQISGGGPSSIPAFGTGTLGYRSHISDPNNHNAPNALFGDSGFLLVEAELAKRNPFTNRVPVRVRMIPLIDDLSIQAVDGTLIRRSRPALFQGLGRRPAAGDRWGQLAAGSGNASPPGSDPYVAFPPAPCLIAGCSTRIEPEYQFLSSDPDIGDFVRQDPSSTNLRKPLLGADDKPISDARSGLFCAFNAGVTTVTVKAGGLAFSQRVRILPGSVQRPCGTRPLRPDRFRRAPTGAPPAPPPAAPQGGNEPPVSFEPPPPPAAAPAPAPTPSPPSPVPPIVPAFIPPLEAPSFLPPIPLPVTPPVLRPSPPSGGFGRAFEKQREEEVAPEESQAFARYHHEDQGFPAGYLLGALVLAALAGATIFGGPRGRDRVRPVPAYARQSQPIRRRS